MLCFDERSHLSLSHRCPARTLGFSARCCSATTGPWASRCTFA